MLKLLDAFPLLLLAVIFYAAFVVVTGSDSVPTVLGSPIFHMPIISGDSLAFSRGDLFVLFTIVALFVEVLKSTNTGAISLLNHGLSTAVMVLCMVLLLIARGFGTSTFLFITLLTLFDVVGGFVITIIAARRDLSVGG